MSTNLVPKVQWRREKYVPHSEMMQQVIEQHIINKEDLQQVVEGNSSTTYLELAERLSVSDETIRLHLHQLGLGRGQTITAICIVNSFSGYKQHSSKKSPL